MTAADLQTIPLQPAGSSTLIPGPEHDTTTGKDGMPGGKRVIRLANVSDPTLTFYPAPSAGNTGTTVVVFPGGGYRILALDLEGSEICEWLNSLGVNAALVKYRVPEAPNVPRYEAPLVDAKHALAAGTGARGGMAPRSAPAGRDWLFGGRAPGGTGQQLRSTA